VSQNINWAKDKARRVAPYRENRTDQQAALSKAATAWLRAGGEGSERHLMTANPIYLVMDAGSPVAASTDRNEPTAYLNHRLDTTHSSIRSAARRRVHHDHIAGVGGGVSERRSELHHVAILQAFANSTPR
jgi:hypothetical protein